METRYRRRQVLQMSAKVIAGCMVARIAGAEASALKSDHGFTSLFDGKTLNGWTSKARLANQPSLGVWRVEDSAIVGGQDRAGVGLCLVSDRTFSDFELEIEARPDWPAERDASGRVTRLISGNRNNPMTRGTW